MIREVILNKVNFDITPRKIYEAVVYGVGNTSARDPMISAALERWGVDVASYVRRPATFLEIQTEINANRPVLVGFAGVGGPGHVVVIGGYEMRGPTRWCNVYDPAKNAAENMPYRHLEQNCGWNATWFVQLRVVNI
jgi:hypothetical protein